MVEENKLISIGEASDYLGVSIDTLRRWEKKGKVSAYRSPGGHRYFKESDLDKVFGKKYERTEETKRESTAKEKREEVPERLLIRPSRAVKIPQPPTIRIIREQTFQAVGQSILVPTPLNQTTESAENTQKEKSKIRFTPWIIAGSILLAAVSLGFAIFFYWRSSQQILTPLP